MIEKSKDQKSFYNFQKKIVAYLDGSLSPEESSEFEAFVSTHPEFQAQVKAKENELQTMKSLMPAALLSDEQRSGLENEMRLSISNLLKEEPRTFWDRVRNSWEDWISR